MKEITLRGSHFEIGRQIGIQMREEAVELPPLNEDQSRYIDRLAERSEALVPELFEEMRGLAEGGGYEERVVLFHSLSIGIVPACTVLAVSGKHTEDGRSLFGRNYDAGPEFADFTLYRTYPEGGLADIGCAYNLLVGREGGVNEAGLAIAVTGVHGHYTDDPGLWDHIPVRAALDRCGRVDEAVALIESLPHLWTKNFLIADEMGEIAIVEAGQQGVACHRATDGFAAITNHFVLPEMEAYCNQEKTPSNSVHRRDAAYRWFREARVAAERITCEDLKQLLSTTGAGVRSEVDETFSTVWSWISTLGERGIDLADRLPEPETYRRYEF